ncbi:MAG TPA: DUF4203 domain-containing protein [Thermoanaerobaculia bacterium]
MHLHPHSLLSLPNPLAALVVGALLLFLGRRLFWLFVGVAGFLAVYSWSFAALSHQPESVRLLLAVLAGVVGILLAVFLQKVGVALAGFVVGAGLAASLLGVNPAHLAGGSAILVFLAGVVAAVLSVWLFDYALIFFSSLAGASLIVEALLPSSPLRPLAFIVLAIVGIVVQAGLNRRQRDR